VVAATICQYACQVQFRDNLQRTMAHAARWHAYYKPTTVDASSPRPVSVLGCLVVYLVECREDIVGELNLGDRPHALSSCSNSESNQALLTQWSIEDSVCAKVCSQVHRTSENTAKLDILSKDQDPLVRLQCISKCLVDGGVQVDALCLAFLYLCGQLGVRERRLCSMVEDWRGVVFYRAVEACPRCRGRVLSTLGVLFTAGT